MTQEDLAKRIGCSGSLLSRRLNGESALAALTAVAIANELDTSVDALFVRDCSIPAAKIRKHAISILKLTGGVEKKPRKRKTSGKKVKKGEKPKNGRKAKKKTPPKS